MEIYVVYDNQYNKEYTVFVRNNIIFQIFDENDKLFEVIAGASEFEIGNTINNVFVEIELEHSLEDYEIVKRPIVMNLI